MPKQQTKTQELVIDVTRSWPLQRIKEIEVQVAGKDSWRNHITLTKEQAEQLHVALADILGVKEEDIVS